MTTRDFSTQIPCPDCSASIVHRYDCDCDNDWGYCTNKNHAFFYCKKCEDEKKVTWDDEPIEEGVVYLSREERAKIDKTFADFETSEAGHKEREALKRFFRTMEEPNLRAIG